MKLEFDPEEIREAVQQMEELEQREENPPRLTRENTADLNAEQPPKLTGREYEVETEQPPKLSRTMEIGESVEVRTRRHALEESENKIEAENRAKELAEQLEKEQQEQDEYRKKLYGE